jgi:hypothetical protein
MGLKSCRFSVWESANGNFSFLNDHVRSAPESFHFWGKAAGAELLNKIPAR